MKVKAAGEVRMSDGSGVSAQMHFLCFWELDRPEWFEIYRRCFKRLQEASPMDLDDSDFAHLVSGVGLPGEPQKVTAMVFSYPTAEAPPGIMIDQPGNGFKTSLGDIIREPQLPQLPKENYHD